MTESLRRRIVFATQELDPFVPGGAGAVIAGLADLLAPDHDVTVVLAAGEVAPGNVRYRLVTVDPGSPDGTSAWFLERSRLVAEAVAGLAAEAPIDLVEFCDFEGLAHWALLNREELRLQSTLLAVRLHGPVNALAMTGLMGPPPGSPQDALAVMETSALVMADAVLVPSEAVGEWVSSTYTVEPGRIVVAPPPVPATGAVEWAPTETPSFAMFGRLTEQKGPQDLVAAVLPLLDAAPSLDLELIGPDGWSRVEDRPMSDVLRDMVPPRYRDRIRLLGRLDRAAALERLARAWAVVLPSRYESFCLAAHEVRRAGLPVVVPDLPPFVGYRNGAGMLTYDGSVEGLREVLRRIVADRSVSERLVGEPAPRVGDPIQAYVGALPAPRHPNSQAGLATRAGKDLEAVRGEPKRPGSRWAGALLRHLPRPAARLAIRLVPQRLKDRFRSVASWPAEQARRAAQEERQALREAIAAGRFPDIAEPRVSVVVPCFEQGEWVEDALASVFRQSWDSWEIVLVDDGSTDPSTVEVLEGLAAWPRVRLVRQANAGLPAARNAGMTVARGEFLVPLDADDELTPGFMEAMVGALEARPDAAFAHCWAELFGDQDAVWVPRPYNRYWQRLSNGIVGCVLLRRSAWEAVGGYDETMRGGHEDWELWLRLDEAGWGEVQVREPLFRYRKHGVSMSVESESRFEAARDEIRARHPAAYDRAALRELKMAEYPLLSLIGSAPAVVLPPDAESVSTVGEARGKYVGRWNHGMDPADLVDAAIALEQRPDVAFARVGEAAVWRRWCLLDPDAAPAGGLDGAVDPVWSPGAFPDPAWIVDPAVLPAGLPTMRQRPEESGIVPEWVGT